MVEDGVNLALDRAAQGEVAGDPGADTAEPGAQRADDVVDDLERRVHRNKLAAFLLEPQRLALGLHLVEPLPRLATGFRVLVGFAFDLIGDEGLHGLGKRPCPMP